MITLELDTATHDVKLTNGAPRMIDGSEADRQDIETSLSLFRGEWFLDPSDGLPFFDRILVKQLNEGDVLAIVRDYLLRRPSVQVVQELDIEVDRPSRESTFTGVVVDSTGDLLSIFTPVAT